MIKQLFSTALCIIIIFFASAQEGSRPKVLIMGTMHQVPKIVKNSYHHLLKQAIEYHPDAIYVERQRPDDSISLANYESKWFLPLGDSLRLEFEVDTCRTRSLLNKSVREMVGEDFEYLATYFAIARDKANWHFYSYLSKYGINGSPKPLRYEGADLTAKLAVEMDINTIYAMDHQHFNQQYHQLWRACIIESQADGEVKFLVRHNKKEYRGAIIPALLGKLGKHANRVKTLRSYDTGNRFTFRKTECQPCIEAGEVWDERNKGMAKNIGEQVLKYQHQQAIVIVGAGHVLGIRAALMEQFPQLEVQILDE